MPSSTQLRVQDADGNWGNECVGGPALQELRTARLDFQPVTGGGFSLSQEHVATTPGAVDSFMAYESGHYYVSVPNPVGESCASNIVYIQGSVTGIPIGDPPDAVVSRRLFDVRGRLLRGPPRASGIYFERSVWRSGKIKVHRRVILH